MALVNKNITHPDNLLIKSKLKHGDQTYLAAATGYKHNSINQILNGRRAMPDVLAREIAALLKARAKVATEIASL